MKRRTFLRGVGGAALALPVLEAALDGGGTAYADGTALPKRFMSSYLHISLGGRGGTVRNYFAPDDVGFGYDVTGKIAVETLAPVKDEVTIVSGLTIPCRRYNGGVVPRVGIGSLFHGRSTGCMYAGLPAYEDDDGLPEGHDEPSRPTHGMTVDQIIADAIGGDAAIRHLCYGITDIHPHSSPSRKRDDSGDVVRVPTVNSPQQAWSSLLSSYVPPDPVAAGLHERALSRRRSVLDLVAAQRARLVADVGRADRVRLERHFDEVRGLERRLAELRSSGRECVPVGDPGPDPAWINGEGGPPAVHGNEELRAQVMLDLIYMAFACDLARSVFLYFAHANLWVEELIGVPVQLHGLSHDGPERTERLSRVFAWQNSHLARFIARLRDTPEGDGSMLDNFVMTSMYEGGHGRGIESNEDDSTHSTDNMCALVVGRAGGLRPGQHIRADGVHPAALHVSAMRALGIEEGLGRLGVDDHIPELFGG